jgi:hypothetical protein
MWDAVKGGRQENPALRSNNTFLIAWISGIISPKASNVM